MRQKYLKIDPAEGDGGFTLLETLIALAILAIALVALFRLHYQSIDLSAEIAFNANAPFLAGQLLSDVERAGLDGAGRHAGTFQEGLPPYSWQVDIAQVELPVGEATPPKLWKIDIDIASGERLNYHLTTFRRYRE
ncbi:MAG: prepilin-type N-terminal cleavage/methylation domain-containing protein [Pseudomonadota bacterium]